MTKALGLLALLVAGCASSVKATPPPEPPPAKPLPPGLSFQPQPVPLPEVKPPKHIPPTALIPDLEAPSAQAPPSLRQQDLPGPKLVGALAVLEGETLLQCTEIYGFSELPFGPPEMETGGVRLVPIKSPCRVQFRDLFIPAMCGNNVSEETRKKTNLIWEQNYYFESVSKELESLHANCKKDGGVWWDDLQGGTFPDFLIAIPAPVHTEMF